jgi:hypothetical protein
MSKNSEQRALKEAIRMILKETPASDTFEYQVAKSINAFKKDGITAVRPPADTSLPDVLVSVENVGDSFVEVKMNHTDNLANIRVFYDGQKWDSTYHSPVAGFAVDMLNKSPQAKKFIDDIMKSTRRSNVKLSTTRGQLKQPGTVPLSKMLEFVEKRGNRYVLNEPEVNIGNLVTLHYTQGKDKAAHYIQASDDFYLISGADPLGLNAANGGRIPILGGTGDFKVRISTRSEFYEIQTEVKIKKFNPSSSPFSVLKGSKKINPFTALASGITVQTPEPPETHGTTKIKSGVRPWGEKR